jgi:hypothetical protein
MNRSELNLKIPIIIMSAADECRSDALIHGAVFILIFLNYLSFNVFLCIFRCGQFHFKAGLKRRLHQSMHRGLRELSYEEGIQTSKRYSSFTPSSPHFHHFSPVGSQKQSLNDPQLSRQVVTNLPDDAMVRLSL